MYIKRFVKHYYIMLIPALLWLFFFSIVPMFGIVMAFQDYNPGQGILHSKFVGLENFKYMFQMNDVKQVLCNTVVIAVGKIIGNIIFPLIFALLLPASGDRHRYLERIWVQYGSLSGSNTWGRPEPL